MPIVMHQLFFLKKMMVLPGTEERFAVNSNQDSSSRVDKQSICLRQTYFPSTEEWELGKTLTIHPERFSGYGRK